MGDIERAVVETAVSQGNLAASIDDLVGRLLAGVPGYGSRPTDGVVLQISRVLDQRIIVAGIVVMIDQSVEPLRAEFVFASTEGLSEASVYFGDSARTAKYGSREHSRIERTLLREPPLEYAWKHCFRRDADGWR